MRLREICLMLALLCFLLTACSTTPTIHQTTMRQKTSPLALAGGEPILPHSQILLHDAPLPTQMDFRFSENAWTVSGHDSYATHASQLTTCCGTQMPSPLWYHPFGIPLLVAPIVSDGHIYQLASDGYVHVLDAQTGDEQMRFLVGGELAMNGIAFAHGMLYLVRKGHIMIALDARSGQERWHMDTISIVHAAPLVIGHVVLVESGANTLLCLDAFTGEEYWAFHSEDTLSEFWPTRTTPALAGNVVYVALGASNEFNALDLRTGRKLWEVSLHERMTGGPLINAVLGLVYVVTWSGHIAAFDMHTGKLHWEISLPAGSEASPALSQELETLYIGSYDGNLYALDAQTGHISWHIATGGAISSAATAIQGTSQNWVSVASQSGTCLVLDARTGTQLRIWKIGELRSAPVVASNMLFQASLGDQGVFAFRL